MRTEHDIKAPDGFLLGGWRLVRSGGEIVFHGARWRHPDLAAHIGEKAFVHVDCCWATEASFAIDPNDRHYSERRTPLEQIQLCPNCGEESPRGEAACLACGHTKPWAAEST